MITVLCSETPQTLLVSGVLSQSERKPGEEVSLFLADTKWSFLAFGEITAVRPDPKWPGRYRFDVRVMADKW